MSNKYFLLFTACDNGVKNTVSETCVVVSDVKYGETYKDCRRYLDGEKPLNNLQFLDKNDETKQFVLKTKKNVITTLYDYDKIEGNGKKKNNISEIKQDLLAQINAIKNDEKLNAKQKEEKMNELLRA